MKGLRHHQKTAASCSWWRSGKLGEEITVEENRGGEEEEDFQEARTQRTSPGAENVEDIIDDFDDPAGFADLFHFIPSSPPEPVGIGEAGPGPSTARYFQNLHILEEEEGDLQYIQNHPDAGKVIRMDDTLHDLWRASFQQDQDGDFNMESSENANAHIYSPFASELDWKIAQWAVKDQIGKNSLDRLLLIPGVSYIFECIISK
jgi:hypothetical protein